MERRLEHIMFSMLSGCNLQKLCKCATSVAGALTQCCVWCVSQLQSVFVLQGCHGGRPVTLIGCSMGARLVFHCLLELSRMGLRGCVENVILLGAPLSCRWACAAMGDPSKQGCWCMGRSCRGPC